LLFYIPCATIMLTFLAISASVVPNISSWPSFFFFKLVYINCTEESHYGISIFCSLTRLVPHYGSFFFLPPYPYLLTVFSGFHYVIFIHRHNVLWYYSYPIFLFCSPLYLSPPQTVSY
jgi:hypothetical protein